MPPKNYRLDIAARAQKNITALQPKIQRQVRQTIHRLVDTLNQGQRPQDMKKLQGETRTYRIDSGEYRVVFDLDDSSGQLTILHVLHRKDAYRNL